MFEKASRTKLRFNSPKGQLSVEDLWDLPLTAIDKLAAELYRELKNATENVSFISPDRSASAETQLKFDLVKHIIDVRVAELNAQAEAAKTRQRKSLLIELIDRKENEALASASIEDLRKMAADL